MQSCEIKAIHGIHVVRRRAIFFALFVFAVAFTSPGDSFAQTPSEILTEDISSDVVIAPIKEEPEILAPPPAAEPPPPETPTPTPTPAPTPATAAPAEPAPLPKPALHSYVGLSLVNGFASIKGSAAPDITASLLSQSQVGFKFQWRKKISDRLEFDFTTENRTFPLEPPENRSIEGHGLWTESLVSVPAVIHSGWRLGPVLGYRAEPFITNITEHSVRVDTLPLLVLGAVIENDLPLGPPKNGFLLSTTVSVHSVPESKQSQVTILRGTGAKMELRLRRFLSDQTDINAGATYHIQNYETTLGEIASQEALVSLGVIFHFGEDTP